MNLNNFFGYNKNKQVIEMPIIESEKEKDIKVINIEKFDLHIYVFIYLFFY